MFDEYGDGSAVVGVVYFLGGGFLELSGATPARANGFSTLWLQVPDVQPGGDAPARPRRSPRGSGLAQALGPMAMP
jgi:hypothetical protein